MFKVSPASLQTFIDTPNCSWRPCSVWHSPHSECILWWPSSAHQLCGDRSNTYTEFLLHPRKKIGQRRIWRSWRPNGFRNDSVRKHLVQECHRHMSCNAILLKVGLVNFVFQLHNEGIHSSVTVPLGVESLREREMSPTTCLRDIPTQTPIFSLCSGDSWKAWGFCAHQNCEFWVLMNPDKWQYASSVKNVTSKMSSPSWSRKSKSHLQCATRLALSPSFDSCTAVIL